MGSDSGNFDFSLTPAEASSKRNKRDTAREVSEMSDAVRQRAEIERRIDGGFQSGTIDKKTRKELFSQLGAETNQFNRGDVLQVLPGIKQRLDAIDAGGDSDVMNRLKIQNQLDYLREKPGRRGLLTSG